MPMMVATPMTRGTSTPSGMRARSKADTRRRLSVTPTGVLFMCVVAIGVAAALNIEANLLLLLASLSLGVLLFNIVMPMRVVRGIEVRRHAPAAATARTPFFIVYTIHNRRRWTRAWSLSIRESTPGGRGCYFGIGFVPVLQPRQRTELRVPARCDDRGLVLLRGVHIESRFPFGLFRYTVDLPRSDELVVLPSLGRLRQSMAGQRRVGQVGTPRPAGTHGGEDEFYGLRDYREGDSLRHVHWRRSARTGELLVREHAPLQANQLIVLLDPWPSLKQNKSSGSVEEAVSGGEGAVGVSEAERVISAAATAVCDALEHGNRVGLIARAAVPVMIPPAGGRTHRQRLLRELASLEPGCAHSLDALLSGFRWNTSGVGRWLVCTARVTDAHRRMLRFAAGRSRSVVLAAPGSEWLEHVFVPGPARAEKGGA